MGRRQKDSIEKEIAALVILLAGAVAFVPPILLFLKALAVLAIIALVVALVVLILIMLIRRQQRRHDARFNVFNPDSIKVEKRGIDQPAFSPKVDISCRMPGTGSPAPVARKPDISERLRSIDWYQFEKLVSALYKAHGYKVKRLGGARADGGIDLIIEKDSQRSVVQCKHWRKCVVGVRHIRELLGTLTDSEIANGILVTLCGYTGEAKQLADKHRIQILNETDIKRMIEEAPPETTAEVEAVLNDTRKICPRCESEMLLRTARKGKHSGSQFWGCSRYPACDYMLRSDESLLANSP